MRTLEVAVVLLKGLLLILPGETEQNHRKLVVIADIPF
jgi:hypothetical protein